MGAIASQITSLTIVYSIVYSDAYQRKLQSSASPAFVRGIHRGPVNYPHKWPVTRKMFPFDDVIMKLWKIEVDQEVVASLDRVPSLDMTGEDCHTGYDQPWSWWRHEMETFSAILALCAGNSTVTGEFTSQRPVTRSFDVSFDLHLNKQLSTHSWGWWFQTPSRSFMKSL